MHRDFIYPVNLAPDETDGGYVVTFRDVPEAITQGEDIKDALAQATDALEEAMAGRLRLGDEIPHPSQPLDDEMLVPVSALTAAKAALYLTLREEGLTKSELASRLGCDEKEVRRLLDPRHRSKLPRIQAALALLGRRVALRLLDEAA